MVILVQDTTEIDLTRPEQQVTGAGPLDSDSRRGVLLHPLMGFTPDGTPLGIAYAEVWGRPDESSKPKSARARELQRRQTPIEEVGIDVVLWITIRGFPSTSKSST